MLPAIFAVFLLTNFVSAEIYVGQNPQNVNAVIKDENGNLVPVTGVADEIVVVDLNYGGEGNTSGMSVDVSVSPVNGSSSGSSGSEYPTYISSPSSMSSPSSVGSISYPPPTPPSAMPVSLPSATSAPFSNLPASSIPSSAPSTSPGTAPSQLDSLGLSSNPAAAFTGSNPGTGSSPTIPSLTGKSPVSEYDNLVSGLNSDTGGSSSSTSGSSASSGKAQSSQTGSKKKNNPFQNLFNPFGGKPKTATSNPLGSFFIELGGSLGPVDETENQTVVSQPNGTPSVATVPLTSTLEPGSPVNLTPINNLSTPMNFSNVFPFNKHGSKKFTNSFFNMSNMLMNLSNPFLFNMSHMPTNFDSFANLTNTLNSLFNGSSTKLHPFNSGSMPLTSLFNSAMNGSALFNPFSSSMPSFTDMMNSFMNINGSNASPLTPMLDSFNNISSIFNPSNLSSEFDNMMNSFMKNNPTTFNLSNGGLNQLTNMMNSLLNTTSMFSTTNSTASPIMDLMNSFLKNPSSMFSSMGANESPFANLLTMPSGESVPDEELPLMNSMNGTSPMSTVMNSFLKMLSPTVGTSPITTAMNSLMSGNSSIFNFTSPFATGNTTGLKNMFQNILPSSLFGGSSSDDEGYEDYPEDDIYQDLLTQPGSSSDEDYFNPLSSLLPPKMSAPSLFSSNGTDWTHFGTSGNSSQLLTGVLNMVTNLLTPSANGTIPLTGLLDSAFGLPGAPPLKTSPFAPGGIMNPMTYVNGSSSFNISSFANIKPFSLWPNIISALNSTGLFGNLSGLSALAQNFSSIMTQAMNNSTNNVNRLGQMMSDFKSMWGDMNSALQSFMSNVTSNQSISNSLSRYNSLTSQPNLLPVSRHKPLGAGMGTSFLAIPSSPPAPSTPQIDSISMPGDMQASSPASETPPVQSETPTSAPASSSASTSPQPTTNSQSTPAPPSNANGTNPSSSSGGVNLSSTWITLVGFLLVAFGQRNFLGLI